MSHWRRRFIAGVVAVAAGPVFALGAAPAAFAAQSPGPEPIPDGTISDTYEAPVPLGVSSGLKGAKGTVEVSVRLAEPAIAEVVPEGAVAESTVPSKAAQRGKTAKVEAQQESFVASARKLGAKELGSTQLAANLVVVEVDASKLDDIAALDNVVSVNPLNRYEKHESEEVASGSLAQAIDYVDARGLHDAGFDGEGVRVAVLDSGIDYTHFNLGGPGDQAVTDACMAGANAAAAGDCAGLFGPDAPKVKGGFDFVGDGWPDSALAPDPNPIDSGPEGGHGTHVGDIIGGHSADGTHKGIAPGVSLYAVKVCSAVSTSCSGVAMLQGLDWALDPNGDGDISDAVDIVNMSLGSSYGQDQDDSSFASDNLVRAGIVVVASAGNSADRPFIVGSPSSAQGVISVAQTALPDDLQWVIESSATNPISNAVHQSWSPSLTGSGLTATELIRPAAGGVGCTEAAFPASTAGKVALIQRGACNVSDKALFAQKQGAVAAIIFNNAPGDPPSFSFGSSEPVTIPTFVISQSDGVALASAMASGTVTVTIDPAAAISLTNTTVGTSSRGVSVSGHRAKPDIGAPGAWLSAETGTATEETNFGGTSGAAPVVTGVAALLIDRFEGATPDTIKARLLNGADSTNRTPTANGFITTPISRIGAGEVRAGAAAEAAGVLAVTGNRGNVGLGIPSVTGTYREQVELTLTNSSDERKTYNLAAGFRDTADAQAGAVELKFAPDRVVLQPGKSRAVKMLVTIDGSKLNAWPFDFAGDEGAGAALNGPEFDGWITATAGGEQLHVGWTVLPRKAADVSTADSVKLDRNGSGTVNLRNASKVAAGGTEVYALTGTSPQMPKPAAGDPGTPGSNAAVIDLAATGVVVDVAGDVAAFAVATYDRRTVLPYPAEFDIYVDSDNDGTDDYVVYNAELGGFAVTGQTGVYVVDLATGAGAAHYYAAGGFDSSTMVLIAPLSVLGITEGQTFSYSVYAFDNYFSGNLTDAIEGQVFTAGEQLYAAGDFAAVDAKGRESLAVTATGAQGKSTQTGLLLLHRSAAENDFSVVTIR